MKKKTLKQTHPLYRKHFSAKLQNHKSKQEILKSTWVIPNLTRTAHKDLPTYFLFTKVKIYD